MAAALTFGRPSLLLLHDYPTSGDADMASWTGFDGHATNGFGGSTCDGGLSWAAIQLHNVSNRSYEQFYGGLATGWVDGSGTRLRNLGRLVPFNASHPGLPATPPYYEYRSNWSNMLAVGADNCSWDWSVIDQPVVLRGIPKPGFYKHNWSPRAKTIEMKRVGTVLLSPTSVLKTFMAQWHGEPPATPAYSVVAFRSDDEGSTWNYAGEVLSDLAAHSNEGANENSLTLLADGTTVLCAVRTAGGDLGSGYKPYAFVTSSDGGYTWSKPTYHDGVGSVLPVFWRAGVDGAAPSGGPVPIILGGGRVNGSNHDTILWLNGDGDGETWEPHSLSYHHNLAPPNASLAISPAVNSSSGEMMSYVSLIKTSPRSGLVLYAARMELLPDKPTLSFSMTFELR